MVSAAEAMAKTFGGTMSVLGGTPWAKTTLNPDSPTLGHIVPGQ